MNDNSTKTALITGANSGIGFEAAAQFCEEGFGKVILACRSIEKSEAAKAKLIERTGTDVFEGMTVDVAELGSVSSAVEELAARQSSVDVLVLNAGAGLSSKVVRNSQGIDITFASTLIGHHKMTMQMLASELLSDHARIIIACSEAARGDAPGMKVLDLVTTAREHFGGDLEAAMEALARANPPHKYNPNNAYANAKLWTTWWAAVLSKRLAKGQTVNAVSPGSVPSTNFARSMPWIVRRVMAPVLSAIGPMFAMAAPVSTAAQRYLRAAEFDDETTGRFFASRPGKLVGPMLLQQWPPLLFDEESQTACWNTVVRLSGGVDYQA